MDLEIGNLENVAVYPYGKEFAPVLSGLIKNNKVDHSITLLSPPGWGLIGGDAGEVLGRPKMGIQVSGDMKQGIENNDLLVVAPYKNTDNKCINDQFDQMTNKLINYAQTVKKNVLNLNNNGSNKQINIRERDTAFKNMEDNVGCPVVFVSGIVENVNKLDAMIELGHSLEKKGYRVAQIGTRAYCEILDMYSFPQFMFEAIDGNEKIRLFRKYVSSIYHTDNPDIMIIGIPGAAVPYNEKVNNGYGITHFLISMAIKADISIVCTDYFGWDIEKLSRLYLYRFGHEIDYTVITNTKVFYNPLEYIDKIFYEVIDHQMITDLMLKHPSKHNFKLFDIFDESSVNAMAQSIIDELSDAECFVV